LRRTGLALALVTAAVLLLGAAPARAENDWFLSLYGGQFAGSDNGDMVALRRRDSYLVGLGVTKEFEQSPPNVRWEVEGQVGRHSGEQDHLELDLTINVRWMTFPWDAYLDTSLAFGSGLSYATEAPEAEAEENPDTGSTRLLHYLLVEIAVTPPGQSRWSLFTRMHHRSGIWGFFDGVGRASNFLVFGIRYRF
jgi:hypothetical protein